MMMKKIALIVLLFIFIVGLHLVAKDEVLLKLPVRVISKTGPELSLKKKNFSFYINEQRKEIIDLLGQKRSLDQTDEPRNFVLAFNLTEYGQQISDGITHFVKNVLQNTDNLIVLTPVKMYRIALSNKKTKIIEDIKKIVKKDSLDFKKNKVSSRENLLREIRKVSRGDSITSGGRSGSTTDLTTNTIMQFLNDYSREWSNYKSKFLFPDMKQYISLAMLLAKQSGEKWFINFQQREIMPALGEFKKAANSIRTYLTSVTSSEGQATAASISSGLLTLEKSMLISEKFPRQIIYNLLMGANLSYNVILFRSLRQDISTPDDQSPDYEGILREFAKQTGGVDIDTTDLKEGIEAIRKNKDFYYNLIFEFDGNVEDKDIKVETSIPGANIYYKDKFFKSEIQNLIDYLKEPKITISDFSINGYQIKFTIADFKIDKVKDQKAGLMAVKIELVDDQHHTVFKTSKTLKSVEKSITISLPLPSTHKGYFQLHIQARDLFSQKSHDLNQYIKLK
jgi:hypothetical protein